MRDKAGRSGSAGDLKAPDAVNLTLAASVLVERADQAIVGLTAAGEISSWNQAAQALHGFTEEAIRGRPYLELVPNRLHSEYNTTIGKLQHRRQVPQRLTQRLQKDGREVAVEFVMHALFGSDDVLQGYLTVSKDVTGTLALQEELRYQAEQTQAIIQTVIDGIVTIDRKGIITSVNPRVEKMFGYRGHELLGRNVKVLMPEPYHTEHDGYLQAYHDTGKAKVIGLGREVRARRADGSTFPMDLAVTQMGSGEGVSYVGVIRDITERKVAEQALHDVNAQLETKLHELAATLEHLQRTQEQLVEAEKLASLGGLVAGVAHEINTPLGVCVTAASLLQGNSSDLRAKFDAEQLDEEGLRHFLDVTEEAGQLLQRNLSRAATLIRSFKQVAVDRSSNMDRDFKVHEFLDELLSSLRPETRQYKHEMKIECDHSLSIHSLPGALSQVLTNLLQNALIHAYEPGEVGQLLIAVEARDDRVLVRFSDDGKGIGPDDVKRIFEPFYTTRRGKGGTGLGLSVAYNLVRQALQGDISVKSTLGSGTTFELNLPAKLASTD